MTAVQVKITDTADDGYEVVGAFIDPEGGAYVGFISPNRYIGFLRFLNVTVPQGVTISSATLTLNIVEVVGTPNTTLYGVKVADAAAFASPGNLPSAATKTTASADPDPAGTGSKVITITDIVQEIVDQALWGSGNAMAFVIDDNAGSGTNYWGAEDYEDVGTAEATLDITYTVGTTGRNAAFHLLV